MTSNIKISIKIIFCVYLLFFTQTPFAGEEQKINDVNIEDLKLNVIVRPSVAHTSVSHNVILCELLSDAIKLIVFVRTKREKIEEDLFFKEITRFVEKDSTCFGTKERNVKYKEGAVLEYKKGKDGWYVPIAHIQYSDEPASRYYWCDQTLLK